MGIKAVPFKWFTLPRSKNPLMNYGLFGWNYWHLIRNPHVIFRELWDRAVAFAQRGYRGYADRDIWSLDSYLLSWLPQAIRQLRKDSNGYPTKLSPRQWAKILTDMADGLEQGRKLQDGLSHYHIRKSKFDKSMGLFAKYFLNLWD